MMFLHVPQVLTADELAQVQQALAVGQFLDGKLTAGSATVAALKNNWELNPLSIDHDNLTRLVQTAIERHPLVQSYALPHHLFSLIFSRYEPGMFYDRHVDAPTMTVAVEPPGPSMAQRGAAGSIASPDQHPEPPTTVLRRTDLSWTLFLAPPETYDGGELIVETPGTPISVKLAAGDMVLYPASTLHRVNTVTRGIRWAAVGWIQSQIRDAGQRELLYDLSRAYQGIKRALPNEPETQLLLKTYANLLRAWTEV